MNGGKSRNELISYGDLLIIVFGNCILLEVILPAADQTQKPKTHANNRG